MRNSSYSTILEALNNAGATSMETAQPHSAITRLSGLSGQQVSNALFNFKTRGIVARREVEVTPGLPKVNYYWVTTRGMREVTRRELKANGNGHANGGAVISNPTNLNGFIEETDIEKRFQPRASSAYKVNIVGPDLVMQRTMNSQEVQRLLGFIIK